MLQCSVHIHIEEHVSMEDFQFNGPTKLYKKGALCMHNCAKHARWGTVGHLVQSKLYSI